MAYFKITYNIPGYKHYKVINNVIADDKHHAIEVAYRVNADEYPIRKYYKAKLLK